MLQNVAHQWEADSPVHCPDLDGQLRGRTGTDATRRKRTDSLMSVHTVQSFPARTSARSMNACRQPVRPGRSHMQ